MLKNSTIVCVMLFSLVSAVVGQEESCPKLLKNDADLDRVYAASKMVFIAQIEPRSPLNPQIFNFQRFDPVLKGEVPEAGHITYADHCYPMSETGIYLFMLNRLDERIEGFNAIMLSLPEGGPGFRWIAEWVDKKVTTK